MGEFYRMKLKDFEVIDKWYKAYMESGGLDAEDIELKTWLDVKKTDLKNLRGNR